MGCRRVDGGEQSAKGNILAKGSRGMNTQMIPEKQHDDIDRITLFEALAVASQAVGPCRSNQTTPPAADADDQ
jgi:hypothetical protein